MYFKTFFYLLTLLIIHFPIVLFAQYDGGYFGEIYFSRPPSARATALGKSYNAIDGDLASIFYNPAGTATLKGMELNSSFSSKYYFTNEANFSYLSAGYNFNEFISVGFSRNHFSIGEELILTDEHGNPIALPNIPFHSIYSLNGSIQPIKNLLIGLNVNSLIHNLIGENMDVYYLDLGIIKKFEFTTKKKNSHFINLGVSCTNVNSAVLKMELQGNQFQPALPVIGRIGINYTGEHTIAGLSDTLETFNWLAQVDYMNLANSEFRGGVSVGAELLVMEIVALRIGHHQENVDDLGIESNFSQLNELTYGFGVQVPFYKLTNVPINFTIDYTSLPQSQYSKQPFFEVDDYSTITFRLNWMIGSK
ncbi:MAG: hypothetical protein ACPGRC_09985 [Salibacteraceae bacterium]